MFKFVVFILVFTFVPTFLLAQNTDKDIHFIPKGWKDFQPLRSMTTTTSDYDVHYYRLNLNADPAVQYISGVVTTYFKPKVSNFSTIHFNLRDTMIVDSVLFHNQLITNYSFINATTLQIVLPNILTQNVSDSIAVFYRGVPIVSGFGSLQKSTNSCSPNNKVLWTLSQPYGALNWWPCKQTLDDKADSIDMIVTCPIPYRVAGNGLLVQETTNPNNTKTYRWKHRYPIPAYLVAFAVANYKVYSDWVPIAGGPPIEVLNYLYSCNSSDSSKTSHIIPMMQYYVNKLGDYPYKNEKYGHAQFGFNGSGMEHSTMSFMGGFNKLLLAHELAHQWFGDKITCGSWQDIWLNEGFATYMEGLTCEQNIGNSPWTSWKSNTINNVTSNNFGSTYVTDTSSTSSIFNLRLVYNKGALILHMLRWKLGDAVFFDGLYDYINDPNLSYNFAKSYQFKDVMEAASGMDLDEFFNDWLYGQGFPNYNIKWSKDTACDKVYVTINQSHSANQGLFFEMPVAIRFTNGAQSDTIIFDQKSASDSLFNHMLSFSPTDASFDPDKWLCAKAVVTQVAFNNHRKIVWNGNVSDNWHHVGNWDCGIPTANDDVTIPELSPICKIHYNMAAECKSLKVHNQASLVTERNATLTIHN